MLTMRIVSYCTDSHAAMCERFVVNRAEGFHERRFLKFAQTCPTGAFKSEGWNECMLDKLFALIRLPTDGMPTIYVDADVALMPGLAEFVESYVKELGPGDIAFSDDVIQWCAGVMIFHTTPQVREFWQTVAHLSRAWNIPDQDAIHVLRGQCEKQGGTLPIVPRVLPADRVCNWATVNAPRIPDPWDGEPFAVPPSCVAWHANWTVGVERKMRMLESVVAHGGQHVGH